MALTLDDLNPTWATGLCRQLAGSPDVAVHAFEVAPLPSLQGVLSRYQPSTERALVGHRLLTARAAIAGKERRLRLVLKAKAPGAVVRRRMEAVYHAIDPRLASAQRAVSPSILDDSHTRELHLYALEQPSLRAITPTIAHLWHDPEQQIFAVVMELLENVRHADTLHDLDAWKPGDLDCVLPQIARVHGDFLGQIDPLAPPHWIVPFPRLHNPALLDYQAALLRYNADAFPTLFTPSRVRRLEALIEAAPARHRAILHRPLTLIHGDFTPRNLCLRPATDGAARLCAYDWELAQVHLPARDVCELLTYVLPPGQSWREGHTPRALGRYRHALAESSGRSISAADLERDLSLALAELCTFKLLVQGITHQLLDNRAYFDRMVANAFAGLDAFPHATGAPS